MCKHRLLVLDSGTLFWGWQLLLVALTKLKWLEVASYPQTKSVEVLPRVIEHKSDWLMLNKVMVHELETIRLLAERGVKHIFVMATGYSNLDVEAMRQFGIRVWNVGGYANRSVAEFVIGSVLERLRLLAEHRLAITDGRWAETGLFSYSAGETGLLAGKTLGIIGLGRIGREVARLALAFGAKIIAYDQRQGDPGFQPMDGVQMVTLDQLYRRADIITIHANYWGEADQNMVSDLAFAQMKPTVIIVNAARGEFLDLRALLVALRAGRVGQAVIDTLPAEMEPPTSEPDQLLIADLVATGRCAISPHQAWLTRESMALLIAGLMTNLRAANNGRRNPNIVN